MLAGFALIRETELAMPLKEQIGLIPLGEEESFQIDTDENSWVRSALEQYDGKRLHDSRLLRIGEKVVRLTAADHKAYVVRSVITFSSIRNNEYDEALSLIYHLDGRILGEVHGLLQLNGELHERRGSVRPLRFTELGVMRDAAEYGEALWLPPVAE